MKIFSPSYEKVVNDLLICYLTISYENRSCKSDRRNVRPDEGGENPGLSTARELVFKQKLPHKTYEGVQSQSPQNMSRGHADSLELKESRPSRSNKNVYHSFCYLKTLASGSAQRKK